MLAKNLTAGMQFYRNGNDEVLDAIKDAELDKHSQTRSYKILCEDEQGEQFYWLFDAWTEVEPQPDDEEAYWNDPKFVAEQMKRLTDEKDA